MKKRLIIFLITFQQTIALGQINVFIGQTKSQVKDFWETKISNIYFMDTEENTFVIMESDEITPSFQAVFNEKGKCSSHQTSISFVDISIIQARLKKMGYRYDEKTSKWIDPTKKINAKINHYGTKDYYSLDFEIISKEKTVPTKKTEEEIIAEKEELNKITDFAKSTFGEKANCSVLTKKGNCGGYECDENVYTINDGSKDMILISTFEEIFNDGRIMITSKFLPTNTNMVASSLEKIFDKLKKQIEQNKMDSLNKSKPQTIVERTPQKEVYMIVDQSPEFPGGIVEMNKYINKNLQYPVNAKESVTSGRCFVEFIVNADGTIENIKILKSISGCKECDDEVIRLIRSMPTWNAGKLNGRHVAAYFRLPISFKLN